MELELFLYGGTNKKTKRFQSLIHFRDPGKHFKFHLSYLTEVFQVPFEFNQKFARFYTSYCLNNRLSGIRESNIGT